jgi:hypothetical protein
MDDMDEGFLKLTNHKDHPTNKAYKVFFFYEKEKAHYFENSLKERKIHFKRGEEESKRGLVYLYGVRKSDNQIVQKLNYEALGKFRSPIIDSYWGRLSIYTFCLLIIIFAIISYIQNQ